MENNLEYMYLLTINTMEETPGLYHLDDKRSDIHEQLKKKYPKCKYLTVILYNLDRFIQFDPPVSLEDIEKYAGRLSKIIPVLSDDLSTNQFFKGGPIPSNYNVITPDYLGGDPIEE